MSSLHVVVQEACAVFHRIIVKSWKPHISSKWPLRLSLREAEVSILQSQLSIPGISHKSMLGLAGSRTAPCEFPDAHTTPSALSLHSFLLHGCYFTADHMPASLLHQAMWPNPQRSSIAESLSHGCPLHCRPAHFHLLSQPTRQAGLFSLTTLSLNPDSDLPA